MGLLEDMLTCCDQENFGSGNLTSNVIPIAMAVHSNVLSTCGAKVVIASNHSAGEVYMRRMLFWINAGFYDSKDKIKKGWSLFDIYTVCMPYLSHACVISSLSHWGVVFQSRLFGVIMVCVIT